MEGAGDIQDRRLEETTGVDFQVGEVCSEPYSQDAAYILRSW